MNKLSHWIKIRKKYIRERCIKNKLFMYKISGSYKGSLSFLLVFPYKYKSLVVSVRTLKRRSVLICFIFQGLKTPIFSTTDLIRLHPQTCSSVDTVVRQDKLQRTIVILSMSPETHISVHIKISSLKQCVIIHP